MELIRHAIAPRADTRALHRVSMLLHEGICDAILGTNTMNHPAPLPPSLAGYEIRFESLFDPGRALAFPCDAAGRVEMDALSERARMNYLFARAVVGRDYAAPAVVPRAA
jgi:hypothetical protein